MASSLVANWPHLPERPHIVEGIAETRRHCICLDEMIGLFEMRSEPTEKRLRQVEKEKEAWIAMIQKWDNLGPYDPIPSYTKRHAEKMIQKLSDEVDHGIDDV